MQTKWKQLLEKLSAFWRKLVNARPRSIAPRIPAIPAQGLSAGKIGGFSLDNFSLSQVNWEKLFRKTAIYNSIAIVICAYFVADFISAGISPWLPAPEAPRPRIVTLRDRKDISRYNEIFARNLFNERGLIPDNDDNGAGMDGPPVRTSLPLNLLGVIVVGDELKSVASVEDKGSNLVLAVRVNEPITSNTMVQKIEKERVIFINRQTERREFIELPKDVIAPSVKASPKSGGGGIVNAGNGRFAIDRKEVDSTLADLNNVVTQARCVPNFEGGRPAGYRCFQIVPGSIYDKLGMKDNDVIMGINGQPMNDPGQAFAMLAALKNKETRTFEISINRGGQILNLNYDIN